MLIRPRDDEGAEIPLSLSQSAHHYPNDRWSRLSPEKAGRSTCVPAVVYLAVDGAVTMRNCMGFGWMGSI
jgi:hypothetical protein